MSVRIRIRNNVIHLIINNHGKRYEETTGLRISSVKAQNDRIMRLAETIRASREIALVSRLYGIETRDYKTTLYEYAETYSRSRGKESQVYKALPYLRRFGAEDVLVSAVTPKWFECFQQHMERDSGLQSRHTQEKYSCIVRQILKKAVRDGILHTDPSSGIKHISVPDSAKEFLSESEVRRMVTTAFVLPNTDRALQDEIRRAFLFGCCTGLRISDIKQITYGMIDIDAMQISKRQQKTKKMVFIPLNHAALILIGGDVRNAPDELLFPLLAETRTSTSRYLKKWARAAGVAKNVSWHTARHTDATLLLESGADLYTVQRLLGHTKISTTAQYARVSDPQKRIAVDALPDFGITASGC